VTAKDQDGKVVHTERRKYENWNLWFQGGKEVALRLWDITATTNINIGLEPEQPSEETHVVLVDPGTKFVTIEVKFLFEPEPDKWETIKTVTKTVNFHSSDAYYKKK
jgi:hypothetical protein